MKIGSSILQCTLYLYKNNIEYYNNDFNYLGKSTFDNCIFSCSVLNIFIVITLY